MTATTSSGRHVRRSRRRVRIASMESLGFIDSPGTVTTWQTTPPTRDHGSSGVAKGRHEATTSAFDDAFADWRPAEVGKSLLKSNIRWSLIVGVMMIVAGIAALGFWVYQLPAANAAQDQAEMSSIAAALESELSTLSLAAEQLDTAGPVQDLLAIETAARDLFAASASLPTLDATARSAAADAAGAALEGARLLNEAGAYQSAIVPVLVLPELETDGALIGLDDATRQFGEWQSRFDQIRLALPDGALSAVTAQLDVISGDLESTRSRYLDALRTSDHQGAASAVGELETRLESVRGLLSDSLASLGLRVDQRFGEARDALSPLLG